MKAKALSAAVHPLRAGTAVATLLGLALAIGLPLSRANAQVPSPAPSTPDERSQLLAEQTQPQKAVAFNPTDFDKFVGYYQRDPAEPVFFHIYRSGEHFYGQLTGQMPGEFFPESASKFFATVVAAQISFDTGPDGQVTGLVLHQNGYLLPWHRVTTAAYESATAQLQQRIANHVPGPGTEAALRHQIATLSSGNPDYASMGPALVTATREQLTQIKALFGRLGPLQSVKFDHVAQSGADVYVATFEHGQLQCLVAPLSSSGKVTGDFFHPLP